MEQTEVEAYNYQTKKQNSKTHSTISIDQPKFNKTRISTKPKIQKVLFLVKMLKSTLMDINVVLQENLLI